MNDLVSNANLGLCTNRQINQEFRHVFVTENIADGNAVSLATRERTYILPLYSYPNEGEQKMGIGRRCNFTSQFTKDFSTRLNMTYIADGKGDGKTTFGPEDIFNYMYAVFHSPTYRQRYAQFLKTDFPRLPLTSNSILFWKLAGKGDRLVNLHLMKAVTAEIASYPETGDNKIDKVRYTAPKDNSTGTVWIGSTSYL